MSGRRAASLRRPDVPSPNHRTQIDEQFRTKASECKRAGKATAEEIEAQRTRQENDRLVQAENLKTAMTDWNGRVAPCIMGAVAVANATIPNSRFQLIAQPGTQHVMGVGPGAVNASLPSIIISAEDRNPNVRGGFQGRVGQPSSGRPNPFINISLTVQGQIAFQIPVIRIPSDGATARPPMKTPDVTEELIKGIIADFVDGLIP